MTTPDTPMYSKVQPKQNQFGIRRGSKPNLIQKRIHQSHENIQETIKLNSNKHFLEIHFCADNN